MKLITFDSIYQKDMVNDNLRYIDWSEGKASPKTFTIDDLLVLQYSGKLFNESVDAAILDELDKE